MADGDVLKVWGQRKGIVMAVAIAAALTIVAGTQIHGHIVKLQEVQAAAEAEREARGKLDPATLEPLVGFPAVVADDDLCTVTIVGSSLSENGARGEFFDVEIENKSDRTLLLVGEHDAWCVSPLRVNIGVYEGEVKGRPAELFIVGALVHPGETLRCDDLSLSVNGLAQGHIESFYGAILLSDNNSGKQLARYPLSWKRGDNTTGEA